MASKVEALVSKTFPRQSSQCLVSKTFLTLCVMFGILKDDTMDNTGRAFQDD